MAARQGQRRVLPACACVKFAHGGGGELK